MREQTRTSIYCLLILGFIMVTPLILTIIKGEDDMTYFGLFAAGSVFLFIIGALICAHIDVYLLPFLKRLRS